MAHNFLVLFLSRAEQIPVSTHNIRAAQFIRPFLFFFPQEDGPGKLADIEISSCPLFPDLYENDTIRTCDELTNKTS